MNGEAGKGSKRRQEDSRKVRDNLAKIDWGCQHESWVFRHSGGEITGAVCGECGRIFEPDADGNISVIPGEFVLIKEK